MIEEFIGHPKKQTHGDLTPFKKVTISKLYLLILLCVSIDFYFRWGR